MLKDKQEDEALGAFKEAARLGPSMPASYIRLAGILAERPGRTEDAEEALRKSLSLSKNHPGAERAEAILADIGLRD